MSRTIRGLLLALGLLGAAATASADEDAQGGTEQATAPAGEALQENHPAPTEEELAQAREHYAAGKSLFEAGDLHGAVREFKQAYRLSRNPLLLYNIGFVNDRLGERELALFYYDKYLWTAAPTGGNRDFVLERMRALKGEEASSELIEDERLLSIDGASRGGKKFEHAPVESAPPGHPIDVSAYAPAYRNWRVKLFYRHADETEFASVEMRPRYGELIGRIPSRLTSDTRLLHYYIEVHDRRGDVVDRSGQAGSPHIIMIDRAAKPRFYPDWSDEPTYHSRILPPEVVKPRPGWSDPETTRYQALKWGATGTAVALIASSVGFYALAANAASDLEREATAGLDEPCLAGGPCRSFSESQAHIERRGRNFEAAARVTLGVGIAAAAAAGALWYWELFHGDSDERPRENRMRAAPTVSQGYIGATATWEFSL